MNVTPERWQHVARVYELAVEHDPATRDAFVSQACAGDESLLREVQSLLRHDGAPTLLNDPVWATAARLLQDRPDLAPGACLGPYRIERLLGAGGMGEVFSAIDTRLNRRVAIKVLPGGVAIDQGVRARFAREAEAVAALTHPHICTLYDVGRHEQIDFLVMEYLEGDTLAARLADGPLRSDVALVYAKEIASALDHAHRQGIIHRDLKPANIMLTPSGAKLLDFGLAKFRTAVQVAIRADETRAGTGAAEGASTAVVQDARDPGHMTRDGAILGTLRYMAPEQIAGDEVDGRSDLFSLGAVLYEMFTGRRAFDADSLADLRAAILEREPPAISARARVPRAIDDIVRRCLAKDRHARWHTASDVLRELKQVSERGNLSRTHAWKRWRWTAAIALAVISGLAAWRLTESFQSSPPTRPLTRIRSIAVLPLEDLSGDPDQGYFADGMTEQLIADLATVGELRVISPASVMHYKSARKSVPEIAQELQVAGLVEGPILRVNDDVRITAELIDGSSGGVLWAQSFERDQRDVLALQRDVARAIISKVGITLTPQEQARLAMARTIDPEVHRHVLLGRHHTAKATEEALRSAVQYFDVALSKAPDNAMAHAGLAEAYIGLSGFYMPPREAMPKAKQAADTAISLDASLAEAHAALGFIHLVYDWDGPAARKALLRALELNPTLAAARLHYAAYLTTQARHEEAVVEIRRAVEFDPVSIRSNAWATALLNFTRRYDEAIELARRGLEFEPQSAFAFMFQGFAYAEQSRFPEAAANMERAARLDNSATILANQAHVLALAGQKAEARRLIRHVEDTTKHRYFCPYEIGTAHLSLGDPDTAYRWFRKGVEDRADCMAWLGVEPWIDSFRSDPRYLILLRDIGLDPRAR